MRWATKRTMSSTSPSRGKTGELHAIGDCLAPRNLEAAIYDGERVGRML